MTAELTEATARANHVEPTSSTERIFAELLAEVLDTDRVTVDGHFFDDLGADSLRMAQFCARVRRRDDLPAVSIEDVYRHPTIRSLAVALPDDSGAPAEPPAQAPGEAAPPAGRWQHLLCGALQLLAVARSTSPSPCSSSRAATSGSRPAPG